MKMIRNRTTAGVANLVSLVILAAVPGIKAEVSVTESSSRVTVENESVRLVFNPVVNYVPTELVYKRDSGENFIVDNFCLYYQYIENGALRSVNEGYPGGQISNGRFSVEKKDGGGAKIVAHTIYILPYNAMTVIRPLGIFPTFPPSAIVRFAGYPDRHFIQFRSLQVIGSKIDPTIEVV